VTLALFAVGCLSIVIANLYGVRAPDEWVVDTFPGILFGLVCIATASISGIYFLGVVVYILTHYRYWSGLRTARKSLLWDLCGVSLVVIVYCVAAVLIDWAM